MVLGGIIGWFVPTIVKWLLKLPVIPLEKLFILITSLNSQWVSVVAAVIGIILGIILTLIIFSETLEVTVTENSIRLKLGDSINIIEKKDISAIYFEKKELFILDQNSFEIYRGIIESKEDKVREVLQNYKYPWSEQDPFSNQYQRWALGYPDFSEKINVLLHAREQALKEKKKDDAKYLREDLAKLGVVIKDERNGQYVRKVKGASDGK